jgi:glycerophosphoryl diester phosphodiesterase
MFTKIIATLTTGLALSMSVVAPAQAEISSVALKNAAVSCPELSAHRGAPNSAPENTIPAINEARTQGAKYVEMDVTWDKSNFPRLLHDTTLDRTTNLTGSPASYYFSDLEKATAADFAPWNTDSRFKGFKADGTPVTKIPYAWDFFNATSASTVAPLLDVRGTPTKAQADKLMEYADRWAGMRQKMIYMGKEASIKAMQSYGYTDLKFAYIEYPANNSLKMGEYLKNVLKVKYYAIPVKNITPEAVAYFHRFGVEMITWTSDSADYDTAAYWNLSQEAGVDIVTTDRLEAYKSWMTSKDCA